MSDKRCEDEYLRRIHKVQDYIELHLDRHLDIEELATEAGFSKYHFSRIFQSILNESLAHYVNRIRMENALFLLAHRKDKNMTDIAYEMGFTDSAIFSRAFKNYFGVSPREYRSEYSKNCKDTFLLSQYNVVAAKKESETLRPALTGNITLENVGEKNAVYVRHTGTYETLAKEYAGLVNYLLSYANRNHIELNEDNWVITMYHDNPEFGEESQFRTSLCITVPENFTYAEDGIVSLMKVAGGLYAVGHFTIRPDQFKDAWDLMYKEWLTGSGYVPRNYCPFELYRNNPQENEEHISVVDIYVPVEPILF